MDVAFHRKSSYGQKPHWPTTMGWRLGMAEPQDGGFWHLGELHSWSLALAEPLLEPWLNT